MNEFDTDPRIQLILDRIADLEIKIIEVLEALQPAEFRRFVMIFNKSDCFENTMLKRLTSNKVNFAGMSFPQVMTYGQFLEILQG